MSLRRPALLGPLWKQIGGVLLPGRFPEKIGLGCPKCDDHVLVPFTTEVGRQAPIEAFVKAHEKCRAPLQTIEVHNGRLELTGELREKDS